MNPEKGAEPRPAPWQQQIAELQDLSRRAFLAQDTDQLELLWSDDLVVNSPIGRVLNRKEVLDLLRRGVISHSGYDEHIEVMHRNGDTVIVMGHDVVTDTRGGPPVLRRFTNIWRAKGEVWRLIARHANPGR